MNAAEFYLKWRDLPETEALYERWSPDESGLLMGIFAEAFAASETAALIELQADAFETQRQQIEALKSDLKAAEAERDRAVRALEWIVRQVDQVPPEHRTVLEETFRNQAEAALSPVPVPAPTKENEPFYALEDEFPDGSAPKGETP